MQNSNLWAIQTPLWGIKLAAGHFRKEKPLFGGITTMELSAKRWESGERSRYMFNRQQESKTHDNNATASIELQLA